MAIDPGALAGASLEASVKASIEGMKDDLEAGDQAIIQVVIQSARTWDAAVAGGKQNSAMAFLAYVTNGMEKLGGSALARKQLGKKPEKPKNTLAEVRNLRSVQSGGSGKAGKQAAPKKTTTRTRKATGT